VTKCHDCFVEEGQYHHFDCDVERCPFCGGQLIICRCCYKKLGLIDFEKNGYLYDGLEKETYENGLNAEQEKHWQRLLREKGRIPWVEIPGLCRLCGKKWPGFFMDDAWDFYVIPQLQGEMLCRDCYTHIQELFPEGWKKARKVIEG